MLLLNFSLSPHYCLVELSCRKWGYVTWLQYIFNSIPPHAAHPKTMCDQKSMAQKPETLLTRRAFQRVVNSANLPSNKYVLVKSCVLRTFLFENVKRRPMKIRCGSWISEYLFWIERSYPCSLFQFRLTLRYIDMCSYQMCSYKSLGHGNCECFPYIHLCLREKKDAGKIQLHLYMPIVALSKYSYIYTCQLLHYLNRLSPLSTIHIIANENLQSHTSEDNNATYTRF